MSSSTDTNGAPDLAAECKKWEKQCADLTNEREHLEAELAKVKAERDSYLKTVYYYLRKEATPPDFTREEVFAHINDRPTFEEVVAEMERQLEKPA